MNRERRERISRRRFLEAAAAVAAAAPVSAAEGPAPSDPDRERLEELAERYGSELGDVREVR